MLFYLFLAVSSLIGGIVVALLLRPVAINLGIVDRPGGRKRHLGEIPLIGGPLILVVTLTGTLFLSTDFPAGAFLGGGLIVLLGLMDDKYEVSAKIKLTTQIFIACLVILIDQELIVDIGILSNSFANPALQPIHFALAVLAIVVGVNALNLIDGIDGLAASIVLVTLLNANLIFVFSGLSVPIDILSYSVLLAGTLSSFLVFNLGLINGRKVFLGDSGSMLVGLFITNMLIEISQAPSSNSGIVVPATLCLWLTAVPVADMLVTFLGRSLKGKSPLAPDRTHLHHRLRDMGLSKWTVLLIILSTSFVIFWVGALLTHHLGEAASLLGYGLFLIGHFFVIAALNSAQQKMN